MSENWIDQSWKAVLNRNADDAISFFMPSLAAKRDYSKQLESANPLHDPIEGDSNKSGRISDVCLAVPLKTGYMPRAMFVIEQQHKKDRELGRRMFQSFYRTSDEFQVPVTALAILTGQVKPSNRYYWSWEGTSVDFRYNVYIVAKADVEELKRDKRMFALPVLASKRMLDAGGNPEKRGEYSLELLNLLNSKNLSAEKAWSVKRFIYRILQVGRADIDPKVKEVWKMRFRPIDEVIKEIDLQETREAIKEELREEVKAEIKEELRENVKAEIREEGVEKVAKNLLANDIPFDIIVKSTGLSMNKLKALVN
jgi:hypothetical protein